MDASVKDSRESSCPPRLQPHPYSEIFPMISGDDYEQLKNDIRVNGVQNMGLLFEGKILDGRNRYRACCELGIENQMNWQEVELGEPDEVAKFDPEQYVLSQNLYRRHLNESQRAMCAAKLATLKHGDVKSQKSDGPIGPSSITEVSKKLKVGTSSTKRAKRVIKNGCAELQQMVTDGVLAVSKAEEIAKGVKCPKEQLELANEFIESPKKKTAKPKSAEKTTDSKVVDNRSAFQKLWKKCSREDRSWIHRFIRPKAKEQEPVGDPDKTQSDSEKVKAFRQCELNRLETLKEMFDALASHELDEVHEMIKRRINAGKMAQRS